MMSFWLRITRLFRQKLNAILQRVDDPVEALDLLDLEYAKDLGRMRKHIATVLAEEKRLEFEIVRLREQESKFDEFARDLLSGGDEAGARTMLARGSRARGHRSELESAHLNICEQRKEIEAIGEEMRLHLEALRVRRQTARAESVASRALIAAREWMLPLSSAGFAREESLEHAHEALSQLRARSRGLSQLSS